MYRLYPDSGGVAAFGQALKILTGFAGIYSSYYSD